MEVSPETIISENLHVPEDKKWKIDNPNVDYEEYRTNGDNVKIYKQVDLEYVDYADYKIGMFYVSRSDVILGFEMITRFL